LNWYIEAYRLSNSVGEACYLRLRIQDQGGGSVFTDEVVKLRSSPFILLPGYASSEVVYSPDRSDSDQDDDIAAVGTSIVSMDLGTTYAGDPWLQDAAEIGYTKWPGGQMHVVMDLPRQGRALDSWPNSLLAPSVGVFTVGSGNPKYDYGGNIEAVADEHVVVGTGCSGDITNFIAAQGVQSVIVSPQTGYLSVGHIDELVSFNGTSAYIVDVDLGISLVENFINNNTQANGLITGAASQYIEISTATWSTDQWAGGYVEIIDLWYWQIEVREIVHSDATRVYVYDNLTSKGRLWDPIPDPVNYPDRWRYTLVARSEFRTVFCEGPEDFGVVTETVSNSTFRDGSGLHDWSQVDWSDGYVIIYTATQGGFEINPEKKRIVSNTSNSVTIDGTWNGDPYECRYILVKKSKRNFAFGHVYDGGSEGAPVCMAIRDLWNAYSGVQQAWPSRISDLRNLLLQQTSITTFASVPALFDQNWSASALLPGMVNLLNSGGSLHVPNPYGPRTANGVDVFKINSPFSGFVDCWPLHGGTSGGGGEIHCGTNAIRTIPSNNWWD